MSEKLRIDQETELMVFATTNAPLIATVLVTTALYMASTIPPR
nr:hypothetical protein [uncultured Acetatifactor sp.]